MHVRAATILLYLNVHCCISTYGTNLATLSSYAFNNMRMQMHDWINELHICKKLVLCATERWSDLPRRTCTITYDNGDTIFVNEVQPKSTSRGMTIGAPPNRNTDRFRIRASRHLPPASLSLCRHGYNSSPLLIYMRRLRLWSMTQTLPYTAKYNSSLIVIIL
jgi:hypothetical protein